MPNDTCHTGVHQKKVRILDIEGKQKDDDTKDVDQLHVDYVVREAVGMTHWRCRSWSLSPQLDTMEEDENRKREKEEYVHDEANFEHGGVIAAGKAV